jgi:GNAT superfamily N-acetyltransferase
VSSATVDNLPRTVDAMLSDIPRMLQMGRRMHAESRYARNSFNEDKLADLFKTLIESPSGIVVLTQHGMLFGLVAEHWFGNDKYAAEWVLYVEPEYRRHGEAVHLVNVYIQRAIELGAVEIHIENTTDVDTERTEVFFGRMGFRRIGGNFVMEV